MRGLFFFFFFLFSLSCFAQKELFAINKNNESNQVRIPKGSFLRIKTATGKKYSGTLIQVKEHDIVLVAYDAIIDIEEIVSIRVIYRRSAATKATLFPAGAVFNEAIGKKMEQYFGLKKWTLIIKNL